MKSKLGILMELYSQYRREHFGDPSPRVSETSDWMWAEIVELHQRRCAELWESTTNARADGLRLAHVGWDRLFLINDPEDFAYYEEGIMTEFVVVDWEAYQSELKRWEQAREDAKELPKGSHTVNGFEFTVNRPQYWGGEIAHGPSVTVTGDEPDWESFEVDRLGLRKGD